MWKSELKKQVRDLEMDDLSSFVHVMNELGRWGFQYEAIKNIVRFLEKPYQWNREFRVLQEFAEENDTEWFNLDSLEWEKESELDDRLDALYKR